MNPITSQIQPIMRGEGGENRKKKRLTNSSWSAAGVVKALVGYLAISRGVTGSSVVPAGPVKDVYTPKAVWPLGGVQEQLYSGMSAPWSGEYKGLGRKAGGGRSLLDGQGATHIANDCKYSLVANLTYDDFAGRPKQDFINRTIPPGTVGVDTYSNEPKVGSDPEVELTVRIDTAKLGNTAFVAADHGFVLRTTWDASGCDLYAASYGTLHASDGNAILQIYPNT